MDWPVLWLYLICMVESRRLGLGNAHGSSLGLGEIAEMGVSPFPFFQIIGHIERPVPTALVSRVKLDVADKGKPGSSVWLLRLGLQGLGRALGFFHLSGSSEGQCLSV